MHPVAAQQPTTSGHMLALAGSVAVISAVIVPLYAQVVADLIQECWENPAFSQGLLIPWFAAYMAWMQRDSLRSTPASVDARGIVVVGAACALYLADRLAAGYFLSRISLPLLLAGVIWTLWGARRLRVLGLPLALLATMVPPPVMLSTTLSSPLQLLASTAATRIAEAAGVTIYQDGNVLQLAHISLNIEEACSGLTSLSSLLIAGLLFGFVICRSRVARLVVLCAAVPTAVFANVIRVAATAIVSDWRPALAMGFYHAFSGWLVFVVGSACVYGIARLCQKVERS